jgi:hypothetical protein
MLTDYTLTDADIGRTLDVANGFVVNLARTAATPTPYEPPQFSASRQCWTHGRFVLRATGEFRDLFCIDTGSGGGWCDWNGNVGIVVQNSSIGYRGLLKVICVQKGMTWSLTLSDAPNVRPPLRTSFGPHYHNAADGVWTGHAPR